MSDKLVRTVTHKSSSKEGMSSSGDKWLHPEVFDEEYEKNTNRELRRMRSMNKSVSGPYIDLTKSGTGRRLNRGKLIRRRVMVRGKNGKVYYRMQWVDPNTGQPPDKKPKVQEHPEGLPKPKPKADAEVTGGTKPVSRKDPEEMSREEYVDWYVRKKLNNDQKYHMLDKHGVEWKRNEHKNIDHKNAVVALKKFLVENPHHIGAEHKKLDEHMDKGATGVSDEHEFWNLWEKDHKGSYDLMRKFGIIGENDKDPRYDESVPEKMRGVRHMLNVTKLKKYLKSNPHILEDPKYIPDSNKGKEKKKRVEEKKDGIKPSVAQQGGNDIKGILDRMPGEELYKLMKEQGIADEDPRLSPDSTIKREDGKVVNRGALRHWQNMIKLKKKIELNPEILVKDPKGQLKPQEKKRVASLSDKAKHEEKVKGVIRDMSPETLDMALDEFKDHKYMKEAKVTKSDHINMMNKKSALRKILMENDDALKFYSTETDTDRLMDMRIGNKSIGKVLRGLFGLKGVGDVRNSIDEELKGVEWEFWEDSTARKEINRDGVPVLSVIDTGKEGTEWNEREIPLSEVRDYLKELKENGTAKKRQVQEKPLHEKPIDQIEKALNEDFDKNYSDEVGEVLKKHVGIAWKSSDKSNELSKISKKMNHLTSKDLEKVLDKWGIKTNNGRFNHMDTDWKKIAYADDIDVSKKKSALDYLKMGEMPSQINPKVKNPDPFVLHESAKHWTPEERVQARKELIKSGMVIDDGKEGDKPNSKGVVLGKRREDHDKRVDKLTDHIHGALEHLPFDLMTHALAHGLTFHFSKMDNGDNHHTGAFFNRNDNGMWFDWAYYSDKSVFSDHFFNHTPEDSPHPTKAGYKYGHWQFGDNVAHEFAHALDYFFGGHMGYGNWGDNSIGKKYIPEEYHNLVPDSYHQKVKESNPNYEIGINKKSGFTYHKDEWISAYEGRLYGDYHRLVHGHAKKGIVRRDSDANKLYDEKPTVHDEGQKTAEHWSENVSRFANAQHGFKKWKEENPRSDKYATMDEWAEDMHNRYQSRGFVTEHEADQGKGQGYRGGVNKLTPEAYGWLYHKMKQSYPHMVDGLKTIFDRPDFMDHEGKGRTENLEEGNTVRKSDVGLFINIKE